MTPEGGPRNPDDDIWMAEAVALGQTVRELTSPNPWVGAVVVPSGDEPVSLGATAPPGGPHAEVTALALAGESARGSTVYVTLEPCSHHGRTPPCADALIEAGVRRVVVALTDPDRRVAGAGIERLRAAGVEVSVGVGAAEAARSLAPYLKHRRTGRPWVVLKLAATLDGRTAAPDGTSQWITGPEARADVQRLRAESDAIAVGAGTVRADDPALTVRTDDPARTVRTDDPARIVRTDDDDPARTVRTGDPDRAGGRQPLRVVFGEIPEGARVQPAMAHIGDPEELLDELGRRDVVQLLVEGGAAVAGDLHRRGLIDQYVFYYAPALMGGDDGRPILAGPGAPTMADLFRGRITSVRTLGPDVRIDLLAAPSADAVP